jgi:hypothetical protein
MYARRGVGNYITWPVCGGPAQIQNTRQFVGLSGCGCGCGGSKPACNSGLGYFDTGWDISGWGWMEWGTVLVAAYMLMSTFQATGRSYRKVSRGVKGYSRRRRAAKRERLERELAAA